ncbi:MAG: Ig-like domain-containing protein [Candidatus Roizmanbacteria bacterium]|nr:Ig-like domain-containing protein [Candidatus Roizmanbacteria bacterium]
MNTKIKLLFAGIVVLFMVFISAVIMILRTSSQSAVSPGSTTIPTPATSTPSEASGLSMIQTTPANNSIDVPLETTALTIIVSRSLKSNESLEATVREKGTGGQIATEVTMQGKTATITLLRVLAPKEEYLVSLSVLPSGRLVGSFRFTTVDAEPLDTYPFGLFEEQDRNTLKERPDIYLANQLPYTSDDFTMSAQLEQGTFTYDVVSETLTQDELIAAVNTWLLSLGLNAGQISGLQFNYRAR